MFKFSKRSADRAATCHPLLQEILNAAIKEYDFTVLSGHRAVAEQLKLYAQGRTEAGRIVTYKDGIKKKSKHNHLPSLAVDIAPYPVDWDNLGRFEHLASIIKRIAKEKAIPVVWGGDWRRKDYPHFELAIL